MDFSIELYREVDGRWIAEVPQLNILLYAASEQDAIARAKAAAREIMEDRAANGEPPNIQRREDL
jgi:predicted RNase H-like HicB family nuclease